MAGGHNRRGSTGGVGHARRSWNAVRDDHPRPSLAGNAEHMPCPSRHPSVRPARSHSLPVERLLPGLMQRPPLPGVSLFRRFRCYLDLPPALRGPLRHQPPPGVSLFRHFRCHLAIPPASRNSGTGPSAMTAGAREQTASCEAFVLSRRRPAPDAPLISFAKIRDSKLLITILVRRPVRGTSFWAAGPAAANSVRLGQGHPVRGTSPDAWNIAVRTRGVFTHRAVFQKPACVKRGLVRTASQLFSGKLGANHTNRISSTRNYAPIKPAAPATPRANHLISAACINASCTATGRRRTFP